MKYIIPDKFMGRSTDGPIERVPKQQPAVAQKIPSPNIKDLENYIFLPAATHRNYSYPDLLVSKERYFQNKNWTQAHEALQQEGCYMLTIRQFVDFLNLLKSGRATDGAGNPISKKELTNLFNDITEVKDPWRAEWLDAYFENRKGNMYLLTKNKTKAEPLEACLMKNKTPGIDLEYWLKGANSQGLPPEKVKSGELYYGSPKQDTVAGFLANSDGAVLYCDGGIQYSYSSLGVRRVAPLGATKKVA